MKGSLVAAKGMEQSELYVTQLKISQHDVNVVEDDDKIQMWHRCLNHMDEKANADSVAFELPPTETPSHDAAQDNHPEDSNQQI